MTLNWVLGLVNGNTITTGIDPNGTKIRHLIVEFQMD